MTLSKRWSSEKGLALQWTSTLSEQLGANFTGDFPWRWEQGTGTCDGLGPVGQGHGVVNALCVLLQHEARDIWFGISVTLVEHPDVCLCPCAFM
jgi:hypothetical protein